MAVGVAVEEVLHLLQEEIAGEVESLLEGVGCHPVKGKDIYVYSPEVAEVHALNECGAGILYLGEGQWVVWVGFVADNFKWGGHPLVSMLHEQIIIFAGHADVEVIVPWYEAFVADSAKECAGDDVVAQVVFFAYLLHSEKYVKDAQLKRAYVVCSH